ncbi:type I restriction enzyme, S subunit [Cyclobacterium lianum]|uniref:Type I restriction enzyme, S subunit n=1 Tax=Cyclobacterium lianum TaxID=388280 RepID=A0A1M7PZX9_9BACT|nr:restriction endonuclease subunit S [Cyclobacterium lianum]SHN23357.1 type I restriction enzyme, S subunit [Cyclobacterium lianum]
MRSGEIKMSWIREGQSSFTPDYYLNIGKKTISNLLDKGVAWKRLDSLSDKLYQGGIFKRNYNEAGNKSYPYVTATDMVKTQPLKTAKYLSKKFTPWIDEMTLKNHQILVSCAGTVGNTVLVNSSFAGCIGSQEIIRIETSKVPLGYLFAYLSSPIIYEYIQSMIYGAVVPRISAEELGSLPILLPSDKVQEEIHTLTIQSSDLRAEANRILSEVQSLLFKKANLPVLNNSDYESFGNQSSSRETSTFTRNINQISPLSINAFNYSKRIEKLEVIVKKNNCLSLSNCLDDSQFFSSGSFKRLELNSPKSIKLINQSDIFNIRKKGKMLARMFVRGDKLVEYGEVILAGVGTLGEGETFCRAIFANEELEGQLISGEFIRMKTKANVLSGYLYAWLSSDYGFRLIRKTHTGTKLCRPIQELLKNIPVPILDKESMIEIDEQVKKAHTMLFDALNFENQAIDLIEKEIESWQES